MNNQRLSIVIPAYNEEQRIGKTLDAYAEYFLNKSHDGLDFELLVVLNGCKDNTKAVVLAAQQHWGNCIRLLDLPRAGKGYALIEGFKDALKRVNEFIGFVDADMATKPEYFYELLSACKDGYDGVIASRYMAGAQVTPPRPRYKRWGSILFYESLTRLMFGLHFHDYQCGAKIFTRRVIETIVQHMQIKQWAFDVELLYLCKKNGFKIKEMPTVWFDRDGSKLSSLGGGMRMLTSLIRLRIAHSPLNFLVR
jgi:glycosyltransferase involved in cell wall biosynthesis